MSSAAHEGLVALLREKPDVVVELLRRAAVSAIPRRAGLRVSDPNTPAFTPVGYQADLLIELWRRAHRLLAVIVEVRLGRDRDKRFAWPFYAAAVHARLRCATVLLVVAPSAPIAAWARRPIDTLQPGSPFTPLVIGPEGIPRISDEREALQAPELAVPSALAHGNEPGGAEVARAALVAAAQLDDARAALYHDLVYAALRRAAQRAVEH